MGWNRRRRELLRRNNGQGVGNNQKHPEEQLTTQTNPFHDDFELESDRDSFNETFGMNQEDVEMEKFREMTYDNFLGNEASDFDCDCEYEDDDYDYEIDRD